MDAEVEKGASSVVRSATFAVFIILIVFFPILTLTGIEGKYFTPMAKTLVFCIIGALFLIIDLRSDDGFPVPETSYCDKTDFC